MSNSDRKAVRLSGGFLNLRWIVVVLCAILVFVYVQCTLTAAAIPFYGSTPTLDAIAEGWRWLPESIRHDYFQQKLAISLLGVGATAVWACYRSRRAQLFISIGCFLLPAVVMLLGDGLELDVLGFLYFIGPRWAPQATLEMFEPYHDGEVWSDFRFITFAWWIVLWAIVAVVAAIGWSIERRTQVRGFAPVMADKGGPSLGSEENP